MKFKLHYYDREVNNNVREAKGFVRKEAKKSGVDFLEEYLNMIKFTFNSIAGFETIANALELDKENNEIVITQGKINFKKLLKLRSVVLYFEFNQRNGNDRDIIIGEQTYTSEEIISQFHDSPFVFENLSKSLPRELGDYRIITANSFEYTMMSDKGKRNKNSEYNNNSIYWFDFIFSINKIFKTIITYNDLPGYRISSKNIKVIKAFLIKSGMKK